MCVPTFHIYMEKNTEFVLYVIWKCKSCQMQSLIFVCLSCDSFSSVAFNVTFIWVRPVGDLNVTTRLRVVLHLKLNFIFPVSSFRKAFYNLQHQYYLSGDGGTFFFSFLYTQTK